MYYAEIEKQFNDNNKDVINFNNIIISEIVNRHFQEEPPFINCLDLGKSKAYSIHKLKEKHYIFLKENEVNLSQTPEFKKIDTELKKKYKKDLKGWEKVPGKDVNFYHREKVKIKIVKSVSDITNEFSIISKRIKNGILREFKRINEENSNESVDIMKVIKGEMQTNFYFRGQESIDFISIPALFRDKIYYENEHYLYEKIQVSCPNYFMDKSKHIDKLAEMQHYGLPTRLLDLTTNLLVALFFAVSATSEDLKLEDGEIITFNVGEELQKSFNSDIVEIISSYSFLSQVRKEEVLATLDKYIANNEGEEPEKNIELFNAEKSIQRLIHEAEKSGNNFNPVLNPDDLSKIYFVSPLQSNLRLARQSGSFMISGPFPNQSGDSFEANNTGYDELLNKNLYVDEDNQVVKFVIPYAYKKIILSELSVMGMNKGTVYPEIERMSEYLKETTGAKKYGDTLDFFGLEIEIK